MAHVDLFSNATPLSSTDGTKFQVIADRLSNSKELMDKVKAGSITVDELASQAGLTIPDGWHLHVADEDNKYYPSEGDSGVQIESMKPGELWNRAEFRYGSGTIACIICLWCKSTRGPI